ncbi:glycoside hydrolase family 2 protein [Amycolatopsis minnesotensis]|uniref:Glycoside hydrolase family 2 TIM barrel-domain containing protein n=1 Tax=Amycolatopsis minnesotensis TaxID=337894 RepID=A0ABP5CDC1_9PSEU
MPDEVHPRPQLARPGRQDLGGVWDFAFDDADAGRARQWFTRGRARDAAFDRTITVPYPPESRLSGVHVTEPHEIVWYRRDFTAGRVEEGHRVVLHFGAVDHEAAVWVNGLLAGVHEGGQTPFALDITDLLDERAPSQRLVVRAKDPIGDGTRSRGKQDWQREPHAIWYHRTTGIWQPVWLEVVPPVHLTRLHWTPHIAAASVTCEGELSATAAGGTTVRVRLRLGDETLADQSVWVDGTAFRFEVAVAALRHGEDRHRLLWSPEQPVLVDASVDAGDDAVRSYLGFREVGVADGRFLLNHVPYFLRMVLEQGYWPESHLAAPDGDALRREVELIKELGFNGVRVHQKAEDPRFLHWCDRLGLVVWGESAAAYEYSPAAVSRYTAEWQEIVRRDRSHPCVVAWVPLNESWGVPDIASVPAQAHFASALYHLTKAVDPSRPVISNDGWEIADADFHGVHDYAPSGASLRARYGDAESLRRTMDAGRPGGRRLLLQPGGPGAVPVLLSEFGGLSPVPDADEKWFGYSTVRDDEDFAERLDELVSAVLASPELAGFCYTQLTDTEQERNGLLTAGREPKLDPERVRAILRRRAVAVAPEEVGAHRPEGH